MSVDLANEIKEKVCHGLWESFLLPMRESKEDTICFLPLDAAISGG